ncbi:MAG: alpha-L-fucosidase [Verrucomicrobia bacterium]|jgi:alpha-L-fucosidase|nr:alpha-L-fucosidase [Verrucomicrobiota bacterium]
MKTKPSALILLSLLLAASGFAGETRPLAERQKEFLSWKFGMFIHFNVATFNERQWATGHEDPGSFAPTRLDCGQWADAAKAAGMKYAVFTVKHTGGWCLWDSQYTTHDITALTNYHQGKSDLVREYVDAFRARGLKIGLYYCLPGDFSARKDNKILPGQTDLHGLPPEAADDYVGFIKKQLTELLTGYGPVDLMWFDQYSNKYTGAQWLEIKAHVHSLQPNCLVIANNSTDFKTTDIHSYEYPWLKTKGRQGLPPEQNTNPAEVCDCLTPGAWFWQTNLTEKKVTSAAEAVTMLKLCNDRQANYLLNVPPDRTGRIPEFLVRRLKEIGQEWQKPEKQQ